MSPVRLFIVSIRLIILLSIPLALVVGTIVLGNPKNERSKKEFEAYYIKHVLPVVWAVFDPAGKATQDCVERYYQGQRKTRAGC